MKPGVPAPRSCSAASGADSCDGCAVTSASAAARERGRSATASERAASHAKPAARIRAVRRSVGRRAQRARVVIGGDAGGGDEHEPLDALRERDRELRADEAAHRVADHRCGVDPERVQHAVEDARVAGDRDLARGHRRVAEAGQVERDHAALLREHRQLLQPVLPGPGEPVHEHHRRQLSGAERDHVDGAALHGDPALVLAPVDVQPRRAARGVHGGRAEARAGVPVEVCRGRAPERSRRPIYPTRERAEHAPGRRRGPRRRK